MTGRRIRLAIHGINYAPEVTGIAPYTTGLATGLAERGHDVEVFTGYPHYPRWRVDEGYGGLRTEETVAGVRVRRFRHPVPRRVSAFGRAFMELVFGLQLLASRWHRADVVVLVSPPLLAAGLAAVRVRLTRRRAAIGIVVHDVYSRAAVETEAMSGKAACAVRVLESAVVRQADGVAVIHGEFTTNLVGDLGVDRRRIREIRNWTHVRPPDDVASAAFRDAHGWTDDDIVVLHAGNMGVKQGLENVIAAARLSGDQECRVRFVLLGDGNQCARLRNLAAGVPALEFHSPVSEGDFPSALGAADVLLVNERPGVAQMSMPSKLTSYFAAGRPILAATDADGFTAGEIARAGAGICVDAGCPDVLLREAVRLGTDRALARQFAESGLRYVASTLSAETALDRYEEWILDLVAARRGR